MAISLDTLTNHSTRFSTSANSYNFNQRSKKAFLCHSHSDAQYVKGFIQLLKEENKLCLEVLKRVHSVMIVC